MLNTSPLVAMEYAIPTARITHSCIRCSDRKVKCDRQDPCGGCIKHNVRCVFRPLPPARRRRKQATTTDATLHDRLKQYEALLQEKGIDPGRLPISTSSSRPEQIGQTESTGADLNTQLPTPASIISEPRESLTRTQLLHSQQGYSTLVDNSLWTRVAEELHVPNEDLENYPYDTSDEASVDEFGYVVDVAPTPTRHAHPATEHIYMLWEVYMDNVDPLTKVVHGPSLRPAIEKATSDLKSLPRPLEALMFAIYSAAIMSLKDKECIDRFGEARKPLLARYISATKIALSRAKFMSTTSLVVFQALIVHIIAVRDIYEPRPLWILSGIAMRIAEAMGIQRDGASLGLPPFETEIRRRIWCVLIMADCRAAELCGLPKFKHLNPNIDAPKLLANVNDADIFPGMLSPPVSSQKPTDMIFCALKSELTTFMMPFASRAADCIWDAYTSAQNDIAGREKLNDEVAELLETKYLRYCDPSQPLQLMTMLQARSALNIGRFVIHHPRRWVNEAEIPGAERQYVWKVSIELLEQYEMLRSNRQLQRFAWNANFYVPWHAFIHVLDTLRADPLMPDAINMWQLVESIYENSSDIMLDTKKPVHVAAGNLCLKAFSAREATLTKPSCVVPQYISKLRQQREAAKAKRQARDISHNVSNHDDTIERASSKVLNQPNTVIDDDPYWSINGFNDTAFNIPNDTMNVDTDFMLAQGYNGPDAMDQSISWTQWDAWIGDV